MPDQDQRPPRHHLLIAGTGRAGTSLLVRWLAAAGLRTHLAAHDTPVWDDDANAGLEDLPVLADWQSAPYVMKSPWLVEVIDDVLANPQIVLDGVIIPVRDLTEAAASRVVQELQSAHRSNPWMSGLSRSFEQWGTTPGGVVYSLDPVDQARLLAVSFHRLVQRLVQADIPIVLLDFPRLALDADYLFYKLRRFVPATIAQAREAHAAIADPEKIRVGRELAAAQDAGVPDPGCEARDRLDAVALRREVRRLAGELDEAARTATALRAAVTDLRSALDTQAVDLAGLAPASAPDAADRPAAQAQVALLIATVEQRRAEAEHAATAQQEAVAGLRGALDAQATELAGLVALLEARDADRDAAQAQVAALTAKAEQSRAEAERAVTEQQAVAAGLRGALDERAAALAGLATTLEARDAALAAAQAQVATLTATAEQWRAEAERARLEQQAVAAGLRGALDERAAELAGLATTLEARDAALEAAQAQVATLTATAEQWRAEAEHARLDQQALVAGLRSAMDARAAELAGLAAMLEARDADLAAAHAQVATLTATAEQWRAEAEHATLEQQAVVAGLRNALDAKAVELAALATALEARDADLQAAQAQIATLTGTAEQWRVAAERAAVDHQQAVTGLRSALDARAAELAGLATTLDARDAELEAAQAQVAALTTAAEQRRVTAERAMVEQPAVATALRRALDARAAELAGLAATLEARDADLAAAQGQVASLTVVAEQLQKERAAILASWSWRAGQPLRLAGHAARAAIAALRPVRPPLA